MTTTTSDQPQDLTPTLQELMAQMAQLQAELAQLKQRAQNLPPVVTTPPFTEPPSTLTGSRRKTLKRLGLALLGGAAAATLTGFSVSEAKVIVSPTLGTGTTTSKAGAIVIPPGAAAPINNPPSDGVYYGLIASGSASALDLSGLTNADAGVYATSASYGVYGFSPGFGVYGASSGGDGVVGTSSRGNGVYGQGNTNGVQGDGYTTGVQGNGRTYGVYGHGTNDTGVFGVSDNGRGVYGQGNTNGVHGYSSSGNGVYGYSINASKYGVYGYNPNNVGVYGQGSYVGVYGQGGSYGVYGITSSPGYAGYFDGNVWVTGTVYKGAVSFKIDHPLDPANKYLYHTAIESPDMKNVYDGVVILNEQGQATVELPEWFEVLNTDYRYQLTPLGGASPDLHIAQEIEGLKFTIAGGKPGQKVSWQVTGIRQDAYAKAHRSPVEEDKKGDEKGKYLHPELFGQGEEKSVSPKPQKPGK